MLVSGPNEELILSWRNAPMSKVPHEILTQELTTLIDLLEVCKTLSTTSSQLRSVIHILLVRKKRF
jgi:hypothetical protein